MKVKHFAFKMPFNCLFILFESGMNNHRQCTRTPKHFRDVCTLFIYMKCFLWHFCIHVKLPYLNCKCTIIRVITNICLDKIIGVVTAALSSVSWHCLPLRATFLLFFFLPKMGRWFIPGTGFARRKIHSVVFHLSLPEESKAVIESRIREKYLIVGFIISWLLPLIKRCSGRNLLLLLLCHWSTGLKIFFFQVLDTHMVACVCEMTG